MERTFRGVHVDGERIIYREADHPLAGARATVRSTTALLRDVNADRIVLDQATVQSIDNRRGAASLYLVVVGDDFTMAVPVPVRKGSDARTFASRLNSAANRLSLSSPDVPESEVSTIGERYSVGTQVPPPKFDDYRSVVPDAADLPKTSTSGSSLAEATARAAAQAAPARAASSTFAQSRTTQAASSKSGGAAGWFADPTGRYTHRYWDGAAWTEHVARNDMRTRDPMPGSSGQAVRSGGSSTGTTESITEAIASMFGVKYNS